VADYEVLGGVAGAVSSQAKLCWDPKTGSEADAAALREAFVDHLVTLNEEGQAAKRAAELQELPERCRPIVQCMVNRRLLVSDAGRVEIAHEALLRTWEPLVDWIEEGKEELLQRRQVRHLVEDLKAEAPRQRRQALEQLAALAAAGGSEERAVQMEAAEALTQLLVAADRPLAEREDAALVLALIGAEEPLRQCLADITAPVALRRRAAESLGLLARCSGDRDQRDRIAKELEGWMCSEVLDVRIEVEPDPAVLAEVTHQVDEYVARLAATGGLEGLSEEQIARSRQDLIVELIRQRPSESGAAPGWAEHDARLPLLQGAARGLQLAASADLPPLGSGTGRLVPMLTLTALEEEGGLRIRTAVVVVPVWRLPLQEGEQLELVKVPAGVYGIGSPEQEVGRDMHTSFRQKCEEVEVEARRRMQLESFALVRHPITQAQWRAVVKGWPGEPPAALQENPGSFEPKDLWERYGQPGALPVDSVSRNACQEWLQRLNASLPPEVPPMALPSESQWEAACRAEEASAAEAPIPPPFHFGATLDASWANFNGTYLYGCGRKGAYRQRPVPVGFFGLVNRWGLAELHGQLFEWCGDQWHRHPVRDGSEPMEGGAWEAPDPGLAEVPLDREFRLLRGGSWIRDPHYCRAAFRFGDLPNSVGSFVGVRPGCFSPPGSLLGS
jgi:formylglycine-generating enzyme required for sulfatase activity